MKRYDNIPTGTSVTGTSNAGEKVKKIAIFNQHLALSRKWYKIYTAKLLWNANKKLYPSFRVVPYWMTLSDLWPWLQGYDIIQHNNNSKITRKWYKIELCLQWPTNRKSYRLWSIERRYFQWPWVTPNADFKVTPLVDAKYLRNGTRYRDSYNEILIGTYFEWP